MKKNKSHILRIFITIWVSAFISSGCSEDVAKHKNGATISVERVYRAASYKTVDEAIEYSKALSEGKNPDMFTTDLLFVVLSVDNSRGEAESILGRKNLLIQVNNTNAQAVNPVDYIPSSIIDYIEENTSNQFLNSSVVPVGKIKSFIAVFARYVYDQDIKFKINSDGYSNTWIPITDEQRMWIPILHYNLFLYNPKLEEIEVHLIE